MPSLFGRVRPSHLVVKSQAKSRSVRDPEFAAMHGLWRIDEFHTPIGLTVRELQNVEVRQPDANMGSHHVHFALSR